MTIQIFSEKETKEIQKKLNEQFGIKKINGTILKIGQERIFIYQGSLTPKQIKELESTIPIERVGVYFAKIQNDKIRLSIEGTHIFQNQINKNIFEMNDNQTIEWMHGSELNVKTQKKDFLIMKNKNDFLGTGKASDEKITNFIPKARRLKFKN